jgi:hypothetical protein
MKQILFCLFTLAGSAFATSAYATKTDYCAAYARDFADVQSSDKTLWQHKYDIANEACLAEPKSTVHSIKTKPKSKKPMTEPQIKVPAEPQTTAAAVSSKLKLEPGSENWNIYCANKYTSFNAKTGTYTSHKGVERKCIVSYP